MSTTSYTGCVNVSNLAICYSLGVSLQNEGTYTNVCINPYSLSIASQVIYPSSKNSYTLNSCFKASTDITMADINSSLNSSNILNTINQACSGNAGTVLSAITQSFATNLESACLYSPTIQSYSTVCGAKIENTFNCPSIASNNSFLLYQSDQNTPVLTEDCPSPSTKEETCEWDVLPTGGIVLISTQGCNQVSVNSLVTSPSNALVLSGEEFYINNQKDFHPNSYYYIIFNSTVTSPCTNINSAHLCYAMPTNTSLSSTLYYSTSYVDSESQSSVSAITIPNFYPNYSCIKFTNTKGYFTPIYISSCNELSSNSSCPNVVKL